MFVGHIGNLLIETRQDRVVDTKGEGDEDVYKVTAL